MSQPKPKAIAPRLYSHTRQPAWGRGLVVEVLADRATYFFENGGERTFMHGNAAIVEEAVPADERDTVTKDLLERRTRGRAAPVKKVRKRATVTPIEAPTFERQLALFVSAYPGGFEDPRYVADERGTARGDGRRTDAAIRIAHEALSAKVLDAALARGAHHDVVTAATRVVTAFKSLALPKADVASFERLPTAAHERFARALRALLHGDGELAPRVDALVGALEGTAWTIPTLLLAAVHPADHFVVKPTLSARQAEAIGHPAPPVGRPSGEGYAEHLAVARATRDRLLAAGQRPRDLFDVYAFGWRTLTRAAVSKMVPG